MSAVQRSEPPHRGETHVLSLLARVGALLIDPAAVLNAFLFVAILSRQYGANLVLTSDEAYWMQRSLRFGAALVRSELDLTYRTGHPGVTVMWTGLVGIGPEMLTHFLPQRFAGYTTLEKDADYLRAFAAARYAMLLVTSVLVTLIAALAWRLFGRGPALLGGALLLLDPYVIGMTRLLHVDALLGPLMAVSAFSVLIWWRGGSWWYLMLSAVAGGLAVLTRAPAIYLPLYLSALGLVRVWSQRHWKEATRRWLAGLPAWGVVAVASYVVLWPVMWVDPLTAGVAVVAFVVREGGQPHNWSNYFLGQPVTGDPGMLFYPVALALRLGPVAVLGLIVTVGVAIRLAPQRALLLALSAYAAGFVLLMAVGGKKFDRYMLPAIIMLDLLGGVGLWLALTRLRRVALRRLAVVGLVAVQASQAWMAYPYPLAYYNPLLGGVHTAQRALMLGWGEGLEDAAAYLNRQPNAERLVATTLYHHALRPLFRGKTVRIVEPVSPDYFVLYVNMAQRELIPPGIRTLMLGRAPEYTVRIHGIEYVQVYRLPSGIPLTPVELGPMQDGEESE